MAWRDRLFPTFGLSLRRFDLALSVCPYRRSFPSWGQLCISLSPYRDTYTNLLFSPNGLWTCKKPSCPCRLRPYTHDAPWANVVKALKGRGSHRAVESLGIALVVIAHAVTLRSTRSPAWNAPCDAHSSTVYPPVVLRMRRAWTPSSAPSNTPVIVPSTGGFLTDASPVSRTCLSCFDPSLAYRHGQRRA